MPLENRQAFISAWEKLTALIHQYEGSFGSRLHQKDERTYLAYAAWPNRETWENRGKNLPPESAEVSSQMKNACTSIETEHTLNLVSDLIKV